MTTTRQQLPDRRTCWTQKARVGGQTVYLTCGEYDDGQLGELFIDVSRAGSAVRALLNTVAILFSLGLQHGIDLAVLLRAIRGTDFLPAGAVSGSPDVGEASSILDFVGRQIEAAYLNGRGREGHRSDRS